MHSCKSSSLASRMSAPVLETDQQRHQCTSTSSSPKARSPPQEGSPIWQHRLRKFITVRPIWLKSRLIPKSSDIHFLKRLRAWQYSRHNSVKKSSSTKDRWTYIKTSRDSGSSLTLTCKHLDFKSPNSA